MDLHEDNPVSAETSLPLLDHGILDVLEFTPVCVVCTICNRPINGTVSAVKHHMSKHYTIPDGTSFRIGNQLQLGMEHAKQENVATLLQGTEERARMLYECVDCKTLIDTKKKIQEHQARSITCIVGTEPREVPSFLLPCGRICPYEILVQAPELNQEDSMFDYGEHLPDLFDHKKEDVSTQLEPYLAPSDAMELWPEVLHNLVLRQEDFGRSTKDTLTAVLDASVSCPNVDRLKKCFDYFIDRIDFVINGVPPNITSCLVKFENTNKDGSVYTFAPRRSYERVKKVFVLLVSFLILKGDPSVENLISFARIHKDLAPQKSFKCQLVAQFLHKLVCEAKVWSVRNNLLQFCELLCFHVKRGKLVLKTCDYAGSELGHVLHLLRCGTCGYALFRVHKHGQESGLCEMARSIVEESKRSESIHFICRWIHVLRYMASLKTPNRTLGLGNWQFGNG